jgi:preprotein translocase subunit SecE
VAKATAKKKENVVIKYLKETRAELKKVNWPSRQEATNLTLIVMAVTAFMTILLGTLDFIFTWLFELIIRR